MKKTIGFVTSGLEFNGNSVYEKALGGSESALIYMARELAKLDNEVTVYCNCDKPGIYDGVDYRPIGAYLSDEKSQFDTLIVSRFTDYLALPLDTKMNILWCHDIDCNNFKDAIGVADGVFCLSEFHREIFNENYKLDPKDWIWVTSNGYDNTIQSKHIPWEQKKNNYIYASRPERGLKVLLESIWPEIIEKNPDAILHVCGYEHTLGRPKEVEEMYEEIDGLLQYSKNVRRVGHLPKPQYYKLLSSCAYMVYPTDFPEISCINAIEAQYNKCLVITSDKFAMSETVKTDTKISEEYGSDEYVSQFLSLLDKYQGDVYEQEVDKAYGAIISNYSWSSVASAWNDKIDSMFQERFDKYKDKIIDNLVYHSDLVAAWKLTGDEKYRAMLDKAEHDNMTVSDFHDWNKEEDTYLNNRGLTLIKLIEDILNDDPTRKLNILDLGSNDGILSLPVMKRFHTNIESLVMYDGSSAVLEHMRDNYQEKYPQIQYVNDNVINVLNHNFTPDVVILGELLEHIEPTVEFLNMLMKLANDNTLFYFTVPRGPWESMRRGNTELNHVHHFELNDIKHIFANTNLQLSTANIKVKGRRGEPCDNWLFWFNASKDNNISFNEMDYQDKFIKSRPYKSISCCMIVKNEEDNISRCLKSVSNFADEIVIVDTGSTDDTKHIASKFTDKIYDLVWEEEDGLGNFSRARNYSVDNATGDFIFWIDADEQLENGEALFKFINSDYYDGCLLKQKQCMSIQAHKMGINVDVMHDRLFKRGEIRFTGVIHEYPSKNDHDFLGDKMFWQDYAWVLHYGLANQNLLKNKSIGRNADLIYKNVRNYPDKIFAKHYILVDYWSKFITDHPKPNLQLLELGLQYWHEVLKPCGDDWTIRLSIGVVQHFYSYCAVNGIAYKGKLPEKVAFESPYEKEIIEFYVLHPEEETEMFFKYLSTYKKSL